MKISVAFILFFTFATKANAGTVTVTIQAPIPSGAVMSFPSGTCPPGWSDYSAASGRVIIGSGSGNLDALGAPLSARTLASTGGLEYTTGIPAYSGLGDIAIPGPTTIFAASHGLASSTGIYATAASADTTIFGPSTDSNMPPFIALKYCKKD